MRLVAVLSVLSLVACASPPVTKKPSTKASSPAPKPGVEDTDNDQDGDPDRNTDPDPDPPSPAGSTKLRWNSLGDYVYSLDVKTPDGEWIGPCLDVSIVGSKTSLTYEGTCTSANDRSVPKPAAYRLYYARAPEQLRHWQDFVEVTAMSDGSEVSFDLGKNVPNRVNLTWNRKSPTAEYSFDVVLANGQTIGPCVNVDSLKKSLSFTFDGNCTAGPQPRTVNLKDVTNFVICSAENRNWGAAICGGIAYTGYGMEREIAIP